jgi:hypothetical protein
MVVQRGILAWVAYALLLIPASSGVELGHHDQSANHGAMFRPRCSPPAQDSVLLTYWDALTPLSYKHCVEGVRPT